MYREYRSYQKESGGDIVFERSDLLKTNIVFAVELGRENDNGGYSILDEERRVLEYIVIERSLNR